MQDKLSNLLTCYSSGRIKGYLVHFSALETISYIFPKSPKIKKVLIFSHKKAFLIFQEMELFKKTFYISGGNFLSSKNIKNPV